MSRAHKSQIQRRRVIKLMAVGTMACVAPQPLLATVRDEKKFLHEWHGKALGAEVSLQLYHEHPQDVQRIIKNTVNIIRELESLFSLYQEGSLLIQLNREGSLKNPAPEFIDLLRKAQNISQLTSGAFDVTVQPLWKFLQGWFNQQRKGDKDDFASQLTYYRERVGYQKVKISEENVSFAVSGMAITLNGIAQGYITDRVSEYLKSEGLTAVLVDMGEYRALGEQADQTPWRIGLADPVHFGKLSEILEITGGAVATSSGFGEIFEPSGLYHHILDPVQGHSADRYLSVTVTAPEATVADALSTAFCSMSEEAISACLDKSRGISAFLTRKDGIKVKL